MNNCNKKNSAFTLMEMLVVLSVIAILISLSMIATRTIRQINRDSKRVTDVVSIRGALSEFYTAHRIYPIYVIAGQPITSANAFLGTTVVFLNSVPFNPQPIDGTCPATTTYAYTRSADGQDYSLSFCLGNRVGDWAAATNTISAETDTTCIPDCVMACGAGLDGCGGTCVTSSCPLNYGCQNYHCIKN